MSHVSAPSETSAPPVKQRSKAQPPRRLADLPGPKGWPLLGSLPQLEPPKFHLQLGQWAREYGRLFQLRLGRRRILVVADHEAVAAVLRDRPDGFRRTDRLEAIGLEMGLKPGLFGVNGEVWKRQRRMVMAAFDPGHVKAYYPSLVKCGERLAGRWTQAARTGTVTGPQADLLRFTVDAIVGLAFGIDVNALESADDIIQRHLEKIFPSCSRA
jgi:cytochrome P450